MSEMTLSLLGMYNQQVYDEEDTFLDEDVFHLPEDLTADGRAALNALILSESAELEALYPDPNTMRTVVSAWSTARVAAWTRMLDALTAEYNPVHNYDRYEIESGTDTGTRTETDTGTRTENETVNNSANDTTTGKITGFNSSSFADDKQTVSSGSGQRTGAKGETRNLARGETRNLANSRNLHAYGNIGVTTAVQMIQEDLELRKTDLLRIITDEFVAYFCLQIY